MIFVTVGTQLPFDRLIAAVDDLASEIDIDFVAQIGNSDYIPKNIQCECFFDPDDVDDYFYKANLVISHAGMGTIINCLRLKKTIIIFPRLKKFFEHRNDHQLDTVSSFKGIKGVYVATDIYELKQLISNFDNLEKPVGLDNPELDGLVDYILKC
jgi:UDP-N-acetylglucosamine transferase subunit ALG13